MTYAVVENGSIAKFLGGIPVVYTRPDRSVVVGYDKHPEFWAIDGLKEVVDVGDAPEGFLETGDIVYTIKGDQVEKTWENITEVPTAKNSQILADRLSNLMQANRDFVDTVDPDTKVVAQYLKVVAWEMNGLIRRVLGLLDATD